MISNHLDTITLLDLSMVLLFGLIWIGITIFLRFKKHKSFIYLLFFSIFYIYIYKVLDYTLFQYQSLLLLKYLKANLILKGQTAGSAVNLIPLITLTGEDLRTSLLNILLMVPFGFGLPFITQLRMKRIALIGALFSISIEILQLVSGLLAEMTFRVADINDVIFNTTGAVIGYILFLGCIRFFRYMLKNRKTISNPLLRYIADLNQQDVE